MEYYNFCLGIAYFFFIETKIKRGKQSDIDIMWFAFAMVFSLQPLLNTLA